MLQHRNRTALLSAVSILAPIILLKGLIILSHATCIGWDCTAYIEMLQDPDAWAAQHGNTEPLIFIITPFTQLIDTGTIIKTLQFIIHANLAIGTYIFARKYFGTNTAIITTLLISFLAQMNVYMTEIVRNMLALSLLPYAMYFLFKEPPTLRTYILSASIIILMLLAHISSIVFIIAAAVLLLFKHRKHVLVPLIPIALFTTLAYAMLIGITGSDVTSIHTLKNLNLLLLVHLWVFIPIVAFKFYHNTIVKFLLLSIIPSFVMLPFVDFSTAQRLIMQTHISFTYLLAIFITQLFEGRVLTPVRKTHMIITASVLLFVLIIVDAPISLEFLLTRYGM